MATNTEKIVFDVEVKTGASGNSIKGIKAELKDLTKQLGQLEAGSDAFNKAASRAGELRDRIRGVNDAIENSDPEKKFAPLVRTLQGAVGGFAAVQGAAALFGSESEDLQKTLVKLQGAMALSQGLNSLLEFKNDFKDLGKLVIGSVTKAFTTLRGAIVATGIGAAAIAVGLLIANWEKVVKIVREFIGLGPTQTEILEAQTAALEKQNKKIAENQRLQDLGVRALEGRNKESAALANSHTKEILANEKEYQEASLAIQKDEEKTTDQKYQALSDLDVNYARIKNQTYIAQEEEQKQLKDRYAKEDAAAAKKIADDAAAEQKQHATDLINWKKQAEDKYAKDKANKVEEDSKNLIKVEKVNEDEIRKNRKETHDASIALVNAETDAKLNAAASVGSALNSLSALASDNAEASKALGVASATIDTYVGATKAYAQGGAFGFISAAAVVLAGLANVKRILSVKVPSKSGGASAAIATGGAVTAPPVPQIPQTISGTRLDQETALLTRQEKNTNSKVYVLESDISNSQRNVNSIKAKATIG